MHAAPTAQLSYARAEGAESCPTTAELRKAISERLGYDPVDANASQIITVIVERVSDGFRARVELISDGSSQGLRELSAHGTCAELVSAMALSVSIAIDPERAELGAAAPPPTSPRPAPGARDSAAAATVPPTPPAPVAVAPAVAVMPRTPPSDERTEPQRARLVLPIDYSLSAFAELSSGLSPGTAAGASLQLRGRHGLFSLALQARLGIPSGVDAPEVGRVRSGLLAVVLAPCVHWGPGFGCALGLFGEVWAGASGVSDPRTDLAAYSALGARLGLDWPQRSIWGISLQVDALRPLTPVSIILNDETAWSAPPLAVAFGAGGVVRF
ncbi:MAG TPA: hypothetical protein VG937_11615 [Polyangiaceae bacterium]|nr:hypothetical protein [Polyangiaceae bacterium]